MTKLECLNILAKSPKIYLLTLTKARIGLPELSPIVFYVKGLLLYCVHIF